MHYCLNGIRSLLMFIVLTSNFYALSRSYCIFCVLESHESLHCSELIFLYVKPSQASVRPGLKIGRSNEFTMISALKPGGAERIRKLMPDGFTGQRQKNTDRLGTVHDLRFVIFDNDTRVIFASTFDGDWDAYIN